MANRCSIQRLEHTPCTPSHNTIWFVTNQFKYFIMRMDVIFLAKDAVMVYRDFICALVDLGVQLNEERVGVYENLRPR